jgi:hypothetical protein
MFFQVIEEHAIRPCGETVCMHEMKNGLGHIPENWLNAHGSEIVEN